MANTAYSPFQDNSPSAEQWWAMDDNQVDGDDNPGVDRDTTLVLVLCDGSANPYCSCGCENTKKNARTGKAEVGFIQGHDQRAKGKLIRAGRANAEVMIAAGGMNLYTDAIGAIGHLGFTEAGASQIRRGIARLAKAPAAAPTPGLWTLGGEVKIGRWTYPTRTRGTEVERNAKRDGSGEWVAV